MTVDFTFLGSPISYDATDPTAVLTAFITAMHHWEQHCWQEHQRIKREGGDALAKQQHDLVLLEEIFTQFCARRRQARKGVFSNPPEYDPQAERILEVVTESAKRTVITTQQGTGFRHSCRYVLTHKSGRWWLDSKQWQQLDGTWQQMAL